MDSRDSRRPMSWSWVRSLLFFQSSTGRLISAIDMFCRISNHEMPQYHQNCVVEVSKKLIFEAKGKEIRSSVIKFEGPSKPVEEMEGKDVTDMPDSDILIHGCCGCSMECEVTGTEIDGEAMAAAKRLQAQLE